MAVVMLDELRRNGVQDVVIAPGSRSAALSMSALSMGFDVHTEIDERSAGFMADAYARLGQRPGVFECPSGAGSMYSLPPVAEANASAIPVILLTAKTSDADQFWGFEVGADRYLTTAQQLRDLDESQRDRIDAIIAEYRPALEKLADQIAEIHAAWEDAGADVDQERWRTYREQRNRIEVLDFERQELNAKALRQLREVLTDEQEQRLRLPSEVAGNAGEDGRT